jgi:MFS family permease
MVANDGWRSVWTMLALLTVTVGLLPALLLRRQPEDLGLHPDGDSSAAVQARQAAGNAEVSVTLGTALRQRNLWLLMVGTALGTLPMTSLTVTLVPIFLDRGIAPDLAALGLSGFGLASFGSRFFWGPLADRFHVRQVLVAIAMVTAVATVSIFGMSGLWALSYGALTGFGIGGYVGLFQAVWGAYYGRTHLGAIAGVTQPLITLSNAAGSFLLAFIHDTTGSYDPGLWLYTGTWLACGLLLFAAKPTQRA